MMTYEKAQEIMAIYYREDIPDEIFDEACAVVAEVENAHIERQIEEYFKKEELV